MILRRQGDSSALPYPPTPHDLDFSSSLSLVIKSVTSVARVGGVYIYIYISVPLPLTSIPIEASIKRSARADEAARFDKARILSVLFFQRFYLFFLSLLSVDFPSLRSRIRERALISFVVPDIFLGKKKMERKRRRIDRCKLVGLIFEMV